MNEAGLPMQGSAEGRLYAVAEEIHAKAQHFHFKYILLNTLTHQTFGGVPVGESSECTAASADDAVPLCLTTPPFTGCEVVDACYMI